MYGGYDVLNNGFLNDYNYVRQFEKVYIMDKKLFLPIKVEDILKEVNTDNGIIFIDYKEKINKRAMMIINQIEKFSNYEEIMQINDFSIYRIY